MKKYQLMIGLFVSVSFLKAGFIDIQQELYEPLEEMRQRDEAMNRAIVDRQRENVAFVEEQQEIDINTPMAEFMEEGNRYVLEKVISDPTHTEVTVKIEGGMVKISTIRTIVKKIVTVNGMQDSSFESTSLESLSLPYKADEESLTSKYTDGILRVTLNKR